MSIHVREMQNGNYLASPTIGGTFIITDLKNFLMEQVLLGIKVTGL